MKNYKKIFLILMIVILLILIFISELNIIYGDKSFHMSRIQCLADQIKDIGILKYPYYINYNAALGMGYIVPCFYNDFFLIIPALLYNLGFSLNLVYALLVLCTFIIIYLSSFFAYKYYYKENNSALMFSFLYTFSNFIVFECVERNSLGSNFAFILLPWVVFSIINIVNGDNKKYNTFILGISMAIVITNHIQTAILTCIGMFIYLLINLKILADDNKKIIDILKAIVICILVDLFFLLPLFEQYFYQKLYLNGRLYSTMPFSFLPLENIFLPNYVWTGIFKSGINFEGIQVFDDDNLFREYIARCFTLPSCFVPIIIMLVVYSYVLIKHRKEIDLKGKIIFILLCILPIVLAFTPILSFFKLLDFMQFPWRMLTFVPMFLPLFFVNNKYISEKCKNIVLFLVFISTTIYLLFFITYCKIDDEEIKYYERNFNSVGQGEYLPYEVKSLYDKRNDDINCRYEKNGYYVDLSNKEKNCKIELPILFYKGYKAYILKDNEYIEIDFSKSENGFIEVNHDDGDIYKIVYEGTAIQKISKYASLVSIVCIIFIAIKIKNKN